MAIVTDRLIDPRGNNAVEYFRSVLALQPDNADALAGLQRVGAALEARCRRSVEGTEPRARRDCSRDATAGSTGLSKTRRFTSRAAGTLAKLAHADQRSAAASAGEATAGPHAGAEASRASADRGSTDASTGSPGACVESRNTPCGSEAQRKRARCRRAPARSGNSARTAGRRMPMSNCWRCARNIRTRTKFASSSSNSHLRSWSARALRSRPATSTRRARS